MPVDLDGFLANDWISASDLEEGESIVVTISKCYLHAFPSGDESPVLEFLENDKRLALNKTHVRKLIDMFGDDTDAWIGKQIGLYVADVQFQGKAVGTVAIAAIKSQKPRVADPAHDVIFEDRR